MAYYWKALSQLPLSQESRERVRAEAAAQSMSGERYREIWVSYPCAQCQHMLRAHVTLGSFRGNDPSACTICQICRLLENARDTDARANAMRERAGKMLASRHRGDARAAAAAEKRAAKEARRRKKAGTA
mgnify:CR=1 FL=1